MSEYRCPLCDQPVSKELYEKITGIWKEKEQKLADLRKKEQQLREREKSLKESYQKKERNMHEKFTEETDRKLKLQERQYKSKLLAMKERIDREREKIKKDYQKQLSVAVDQTLKCEQAKQKEREQFWKEKLKLSTQKAVDDAKKRLASDRKQLEKKERLWKNRNERLVEQYRSMQNKYSAQLVRANDKIKSLEEQIAKNQTPQVLGLLEEKSFLGKLQGTFPHDRYEHTGKGGDIIHHIIENGKDVGLIVYELKKVVRFNPDHIRQTQEAKQRREADYGILVTNAKRSKDDPGFSLAKGIIVIHPAGVMVLVKILRDHLTTLARLRLTADQRKKTVEAVLDPIQSANFKNTIDTIIQDTIDLYEDMKKEIDKHIKTWEFRLNKYRGINAKSTAVESRVLHLLHEGQRKGRAALPEIVHIPLPNQIR
ncbi:MAG: DUF2130 domain-containing protein [Syntrophaceae bacterium]|nr:DUF2130 domain-containing protein [Syntrophaceae bacterium]